MVSCDRLVSCGELSFLLFLLLHTPTPESALALGEQQSSDLGHADSRGGACRKWRLREKMAIQDQGLHHRRGSVIETGFRRTCRVCGICWCGCMLNFRGVRVSLGTRWEDLLLIDAQWTNLHGTRFLRRSRSSKVLRLVDAWVRSPFAFSGT